MNKLQTHLKNSKFVSIHVAVILLFSILLFDSCGIRDNYRTQGERGNWTPYLQTNNSSLSHNKNNPSSELNTTAEIIKAEQFGLDASNKYEDKPTEYANRMSSIATLLSNDHLKIRNFQNKEEYIKPTAPKSLKRKHLKVGYIPLKRDDNRATWVNVSILLTFLAGALIMGLTGMGEALLFDIIIIQSLIMLGVSFLNEDDYGFYVVFQVISSVTLFVLALLAILSLEEEVFPYGMLMEGLAWIFLIALCVLILVAYVEASS